MRIVFKAGLFFFLIFNCERVVAQSFYPYLSIPVTENGQLLKNAWAGGFDAPVFQPIDLNGDGIKDLFVYEKGGDAETFYRYTTFINNGTNGQTDYTYAPQYKNCFPQFMHDWVLLVDYDCDNREDIFAYEYDGKVKVYHNDYSLAGGLQFHLAYNILHTNYFTLYASLGVLPTNQPVFTDVDGDNDIDILTFSNSGSNVQFHMNLAQENFGRCDTLVYTMATECWGNFGLSANSNKAVLNIACRTAPDYSISNDINSRTNLHSGSCAIAPDLDGDGDKDFINGDILGDKLLYIENGGTAAAANMTAQDTLFPFYDIPVDLRTFPSAYYFDGDNDGNKDLIVAPCISNSSRNHHNVMFYKNTTNNTTNVFHYTKDNWLTGEMIEVGSGANVSLADVDGDGLKDMLIGNFDYVNQDSSFISSIAFYKNTGTVSQPSFEWITNDFANLGSTLPGIAPAFGDMDADGDNDMIFGSQDGYLNYFTNDGSGNFSIAQIHIVASNGNPINVGSYVKPTLIDLNRDGKLDLVIGEKNGNLNYYENTGTPAVAAFTYVTNNLGHVHVVRQGAYITNSLYGYSAPFFYDRNGNYELYVGSLSGYIYKYDNIENNLSGSFNLIDSSFLYEPFMATVAGADINADGFLDILIGNYSGGATWYTNANTPVNELQLQMEMYHVYPNPANNIVYIKFETASGTKEYEIIITDVMGNEVFRAKDRSILQTIDVHNWSDGIYLCKVTGSGLVTNHKLVVNH